MHGRRLASVTLLLAGLLSAGPQLLRGQTVPANWEHAAPAHRVESADIAILGQIARPGLYRVSASAPTLLDMIRVAGGLTEQASGNIRVVRNEQVVQHVFVSPTRQRAVFGGDLKAAPGDVILVEQTVIRNGTLRPIGHSSGRPARVQLALVNLAASPAVVPIAAEHATVPGILRLINHSVELAPTVRVLRAGGDEAFETDLETLPSGSVLIFDPSVIEIDKVPPLPAPTVADVPRPLPAERHAGEEFVEEDSDVLTPFPTPVDEPRMAQLPVSRGPSVELLDAPPDESDQPIRVAQRSSVPMPVDVPWQSHIDSGPYGSMGAPKSAAAADFGTNSTTAAFDPQTGPADSMTELTEETSGGFNGASLAAVLVLGGLTLLAAVKIRSGIKANRTSTRAATRTAGPKVQSSLALLINNQLPLEERPFEVPTGMSFSGRLGASQKLRADAAQTVAAPHFPVTIATPRREESAMARSETTAEPVTHRVDRAAAPVAGPARSRVGAPAAKGAGLLDRVLAAVNQERRS